MLIFLLQVEVLPSPPVPPPLLPPLLAPSLPLLEPAAGLSAGTGMPKSAAGSRAFADLIM
jgi:hypothetical protein